MGCFGYICKGCGTSIRGNCWEGGEKTVMIHVRNGVEIGRVEGHYDEYGRVIEEKDFDEDKKFRGHGDGINSHSEICKSEFDLEDSYDNVLKMRLYNGKECTFDGYLSELVFEELDKYDDIRNSKLYGYLPDEFKVKIESLYNNEKDELKRKAAVNMSFHCGMSIMNCDNRDKIYSRFKKLPQVTREKYSGIVAWHSKCYHEAPKEKQNDLTPSLGDENQSWGKVRKKYK